MSQGRNGTSCDLQAPAHRLLRHKESRRKFQKGVTASALAVVGRMVPRWNGGARAPSGGLGATVAVAGWQREEVRATSAAKNTQRRQKPE